MGRGQLEARQGQQGPDGGHWRQGGGVGQDGGVEALGVG